jgi:hypothetical protein
MWMYKKVQLIKGFYFMFSLVTRSVSAAVASATGRVFNIQVRPEDSGDSDRSGPSVKNQDTPPTNSMSNGSSANGVAISADNLNHLGVNADSSNATGHADSRFFNPQDVVRFDRISIYQPLINKLTNLKGIAPYPLSENPDFPDHCEINLLDNIHYFIAEFDSSSRIEDWVVFDTDFMGNVVLNFNVEKLTSRIPTDASFIESNIKGLPEMDTDNVVANIMTSLQENMLIKHHHTSIHAYLMGEYCEQSMWECSDVEDNLTPLGKVIGVSHDVVQWRPKNSEFQSAVKLIDELERSPFWIDLNDAQKESIKLLVVHSICDFTTVNFSKLMTFGEERLVSSDIEPRPKESILENFGVAMARNDLFSKIERLGNPKNLSILIGTDVPLSLQESRAMALMLQIVQVAREFKSPDLLPFIATEGLNESVSGLGDALKVMIEKDFSSFWKNTHNPGKVLNELFDLKEDAVKTLLLGLMDRSDFLIGTVALVNHFYKIGNPGYALCDTLYGSSPNDSIPLSSSDANSRIAILKMFQIALKSNSISMFGSIDMTKLDDDLNELRDKMKSTINMVLESTSKRSDYPSNELFGLKEVDVKSHLFGLLDNDQFLRSTLVLVNHFLNYTN